MKIQVRIEAEVYQVEVGDLHARPIVATIMGEAYEVWPDATAGLDLPSPVPPASAQIVPPLPPLAPTAPLTSAPPAPPAPDRRGPRAVSAPLPGVVIAVPAQLGQQIVAGQELCVLEAMKMLNTVRAQRAGQIAAVHVTVGQHVQYNDVLFEYAD